MSDDPMPEYLDAIPVTIPEGARNDLTSTNLVEVPDQKGPSVDAWDEDQQVDAWQDEDE